MTGPATAVFLIVWMAACGILIAAAVFTIWVAFLDPGDDGDGPGDFETPAPDPAGGVTVPVITRRDVQLVA